MPSTVAKAAAPNRFQRRRDRTRHELLQAAQRVLARRGYHAAKVADIAREADVGVGTFYLYYKTKEAIFTELVDETGRLLRRQIEAVRARVSDPRVYVRASCEAFFQFAHEHRELFRIVFGPGGEFHEAVRRAQARFVADGFENITRGMNRGLFRRNRPEVLAQALVGISTQVVSWWIDQEAVSLAEVTEAVVDFIFHGVGGGRPAKAKPA
ncbi:MAG: TetR/AcrR family transcriptional regulator [Deltaproteobacteria bacterium]|nr:TetR/AcrR family transcriptional regulator [Deltaproteobacteria bacterium]